jgi:two-component system response regulator RstA
MLALLVEDDARLAEFTASYLSEHEITVVRAGDGEAALAAAARQRFDVIVLDVMLPVKDGLSVCRTLREKSDVPILLVTARAEEADRVLGLELGADDYITKPFSPRELLARMRSAVRRDRGELGPKSREIRVGPLTVHLRTRSVTVGGRPIGLTTAEFDVLAALAEHPGRVLSREQLLRNARGTDSEAFDRAIDVQVSRLRQKLGDATMIRTVRGLGYMLADGE